VSTLAQDEAARVFEDHRGYLFSIAYRLFGTVGDAEDAVQEAFLRWVAEPERNVRSPRAYLATIVVRLCIDELRSARARREVYVGPWLPEPLITTGRTDLTETAVLRESLSFAFLYMLERLSAIERAVFVLREVFDYDYAEIADMVSKSPANCRQVFHRARQRLGEQESRFAATLEQQERVTQQFLRASATGEVEQLVAMLTEDVVSISDGGGKALAALRPVVTPDRVARGFLGNVNKLPPDAVWVEEVNGQPAIVATRDGQPYGVVLLDVDVAGDRVRRLFAVANPDKLLGLAAQLAMRL
jgi:RNA polymerase sigma-70 factor (ECF subfamily)